MKMNRKYISLVVLAILFACLSGCTRQKAKLFVATDLHYLSPSLHDNGAIFNLLMENSDGKVTPYSYEITQAFAMQVENEKPDVLILSGDLTFNGEKQSHEELVEVLRQIEESGVPVLVIPGNHDIDNGNARQYFGEEYSSVDSVTAEEFADLYKEFGLGEAESRDPASLSYVYRINKDLAILMLDTNAYGELFMMNSDWVAEVLADMKKQGTEVICVTHQNIMIHNENNYFGYQLYDWEELKGMLLDNGVRLNLSGHIHAQHIRQEDGLTEVVTSSLMVPPIQYGSIAYDGNIDYHTETVDVKAWADSVGSDDINLQDFDNYALEYFKVHSTDRLRKRLVDEDISDEEKEELIRSFGELNAWYFSGKPYDLTPYKDAVKLWEIRGNKYVQLMAERAEEDHTKITLR